jgi:hypothetical protein
VNEVRQGLRKLRAPDEAEAEARAWAVVSSAVPGLDLSPRPRSRRRLTAALALAALLGVVALSPAGATVGRLITRALGVRHASPALFSLPTSGRLLVSGPGGTWSIGPDGSTRRLGPWRQASWSPRGLYVAVAEPTQLAAVDPKGVPQWTIARRAVDAPRWFSPTGYRMAYLSGQALRVVAGDGSGDRILASDVARVAPAWRPDHAYQLAFVTRAGKLVVEDADSGRVLWRAAVGSHITQLAWSGPRVVAFSPGAVRAFAPPGRTVSRIRLPRATPLLAGALAPNGHTAALVLGGSGGEVILTDLDEGRMRRLLAGFGLGDVTFSPDGRWLLVAWPAADQWVFIRVTGQPRVVAVSHIRRQFSGGRGFPELDGWCCSSG